MKKGDEHYTPSAVYEAVKAWAIEEYGWQGREVVRPFWPGGDYEAYEYPPDCVVIDNPPFSIESRVVSFYERRGIDYLLFAQAKTLFSLCSAKSRICVGAKIVYESGLEVTTSFVCSQGAAIQSAPELYRAIEKAQVAPCAGLPRYSYPDGVVTFSAVDQMSRYGVQYEESRVQHIRQPQSQKAAKKSIYGGGRAYIGAAGTHIYMRRPGWVIG